MKRGLRHLGLVTGFFAIFFNSPPCPAQPVARQNFFLTCVAFGNGRFVAAGENRLILVSRDGRNWQKKSSSLPNDSIGINFTREVYAAGGDAVTMVRPIAVKTETNLPSRVTYRFQAITFGNGRFVLLGENGEFYVSPDGERWQPVNVPTTASFRSVVWGGGKFVAVGNNGKILASSNGLDWAWKPSGTDKTLLDVAYGNGLFVAVGGSSDESVVLISEDGERWRSIAANFHGAIGAVAFGKNRFIASRVNLSGALMTSANGVDWQTRGTSPGFVNGLIYGDRGFVAVGDNQPCVSDDGELWLPRFQQRKLGGQYRRAAFGNGVYVAVGPNSLAVSQTGVDWNYVAPPQSRLMYGSIRFNRIFRALDDARSMRPLSPTPADHLFTTNGVTWTNRAGVSLPGNVDGHRVVFPQGGKTYELAVLFSEDGITWRRLNTNGVATEITSTLPVEAAPPVASSAPSPSEIGIVVELNGQPYRLNIPGELGKMYDIQASTDLEHWITLARVTIDSTSFSFVDPDATEYPQRFYRLNPVR